MTCDSASYRQCGLHRTRTERSRTRCRACSRVCEASEAEADWGICDLRSGNARRNRPRVAPKTESLWAHFWRIESAVAVQTKGREFAL